MRDRKTLKRLERARKDKDKKDKREGKAPSTRVGECVREEIEHIREGRHGARSAKPGHCRRPLQRPARRRDPEATIGFDDVAEWAAEDVAQAVRTTGEGVAREAEG
jgi:hypothetical protein